MRNKLQKYIEKQPQYPSGFRCKTPILVSDSKGFTLRNTCINKEFPLETWCLAGARTARLVDLIEERLGKAIKRHKSVVIYLWSGTCDFTEKKGKFIKIRHLNNKAVDEIIKEYVRAVEIIDHYPGAEIKFVDCPFISISKWNKNKGHKAPGQFKIEDFRLTKQIEDLNIRIIEINNKLDKNTIKTSRYYLRGRPVKGGKTRKSIRININSRDGVHPGQLLSLVITKQLLLDTYTECYYTLQESNLIQLRVEEEELLSLV